MPITINGSGSIAGISAGGLPDNCITTADIAANAITAEKIDSPTQSGLAKAWVNFNGAVAGTFAGGSSLVSRTAGSTTATITTTNSHGLTTGNFVWALTGVVAGSYAVTVLTNTTFTITTVATTVLNSVGITFQLATIRNSYNINSIAKNGTGDYTVNFTTPITDADYCYQASSRAFATGASTGVSVNGHFDTAPTSNALRLATKQTGTFVDATVITVAVFR
jgi:hypothetical protein